MLENAPAQATRRVLASLCQRLDLQEQFAGNREGVAYLPLTGHSGARGELRVYRGAGLDKVMHLELLDGSNLEASMLTAFSAPESLAPHLVLDAARIGRDFVIFVDLVPRVDLGVHPDYVRTVYQPLNDAAEALHDHPSLGPSKVPLSLAPYVSPWMRGFRCGRDELVRLFEHVAPYVSQWATLLRRDLGGLGDTKAAVLRDRAHRRAMFDRASDPVWDVLSGVLGSATVDRVLKVLREPG